MPIAKSRACIQGYTSIYWNGRTKIFLEIIKGYSLSLISLWQNSISLTQLFPNFARSQVSFLSGPSQQQQFMVSAMLDYISNWSGIIDLPGFSYFICLMQIRDKEHLKQIWRMKHRIIEGLTSPYAHWSIGWVCHNFLKRREVKFSCYNRSTCMK